MEERGKSKQIKRRRASGIGISVSRISKVRDSS